MITITQWEIEAKQDIEKFVSYWIKARKNNPEGFPPLMDSRDWDDQYISWQNLEKQRDDRIKLYKGD